MFTKAKIGKIREFVQRKPVDLVYLFGSRAGGQTGPLSDYDFAVLFDGGISSQQRSEEKLELMHFLTKFLETDRVDVLDLNSAPCTLRFAAIRPRLSLYVRSEADRIDFEKRTMSDYFDRLYYLERHTKTSLGTISREGLAT